MGREEGTLCVAYGGRLFGKDMASFDNDNELISAHTHTFSLSLSLSLKSVVSTVTTE